MILDEPLFEPIARYWRFNEGIKEMVSHKPVSIVDLGCGPLIRFYYFLQEKGIQPKAYFGIDPLIDDTIVDQHKYIKNITLIKNALKRKIPLQSGRADYVVGFAFLEHVDDPKSILNEAIRLLKKGGKVIFTTPSPRSKLLLELLTKLNLISHREIHEHKQYLDRFLLLNMINKENKKKVHIRHSYFHPWENNLLVLQKK